ncbi:MAG: histidinol dehydrogenase, partial [Betaproteobacteria bacterium]|nr:histidinol dehydrogenase [Betaproteobacteria bacterium]
MLAHEAGQDESISQTVKEIIAAVRARGDEALLDLTQRFDRLTAASVADLEIPRSELERAFNALPDAQRSALTDAAARIRHFHEQQRQSSWSITDELGCELGQRVTPLDRAGLYVPGGKAAYPSSVLMNAIPAKV